MDERWRLDGRGGRRERRLIGRGRPDGEGGKTREGD